MLNPGPNQNTGIGLVTSVPEETRRLSPIRTRVRLRGRDMYGGPIVFGAGSMQSSLGTSSSTSLPPIAAGASMASSLKRSNRLLSAAPYNASMRIHNRNQRQSQQQQQQLNYSKKDHEDYSQMDQSGISSTAKVILDTLEKMSTPIKDAQKIPLPAARAETRRAIAEQLLECPSSSSGGGCGGSAGSSPTTSAGSESSSSYSRRRPRLGRTTPVLSSNTSGQLLNGPPLRTLFSPVPSTIHGATTASRCERNGSLSVTTYTPSSSVKRLSGNESMPNSKSSKTVSTATLALSPGKKNTFPFSVPDLHPSTKTKNVVRTSSSGKIRSKVGEKAKLRTEKALFDGVGNSNGEEQPQHLRNATETINPFMKMNAMPQFNFPQEGGIRGVSNSKNANREDRDNSAQVADKLKTSSCDNPLPVSSNSVNMSFLTSEHQVSIVPKSAGTSTGPTNFTFTQPLLVAHLPVCSLGNSDHFSYAFSDPAKLSSGCAGHHRDLNKMDAARSSFASPLMSSSSRIANLPDLTSSASSCENLKKLSEPQPKPVGIAPVAETLKSASVMDILSGNGHHKLPDVAASAGKLSSPVKLLAQGTVLDILGQNSQNGSDSWNFSQPRKPWH